MCLHSRKRGPTCDLADTWNETKPTKPWSGITRSEIRNTKPTKLSRLCLGRENVLVGFDSVGYGSFGRLCVGRGDFFGQLLSFCFNLTTGATQKLVGFSGPPICFITDRRHEEFGRFSETKYDHIWSEMCAVGRFSGCVITRFGRKWPELVGFLGTKIQKMQCLQYELYTFPVIYHTQQTQTKYQIISNSEPKTTSNMH